MIDLLSNTKSTAFVESAFRLLQIQSIRNSRNPKNQVKTISIQADFNENIYSIYAELPLTIVPNPVNQQPELQIEEPYSEEEIEVYGSIEDLGGLVTDIGFQLEIEEQIIEDGEYIDSPDYYYPNDYFSFPLEYFDQSEYSEEIDWGTERVEVSFKSILVLPNNSTELNTSYLDLSNIPSDDGFYVSNPKNIESKIDIEEMKVFITATMPFTVSIESQGKIRLTPIDYA